MEDITEGSHRVQKDLGRQGASCRASDRFLEVWDLRMPGLGVEDFGYPKVPTQLVLQFVELALRELLLAVVTLEVEVHSERQTGHQ